VEAIPAKPIFIVGSPRSGTSILTWCLGQHPNIIPLDESNGLGNLTIALGICYQTRIGLSTESLWTALNVQKNEFFSVFGQPINELILRHKVDLERRRWQEAAGPNVSPERFVTEHSAKTRWVDGTPEYSFHIYGLRQLFPDARFIHIVRDVTSVVRSMLNFHRLAGVKLVANEQEAYCYWYRAVTACLLAERAYGPRVIFRLQYSDLVHQAETSLRALLSFLGEPYAAECLIPLRERINSSNVPADFKLGDADSDPEIIERAIRLNAEISTSPQPFEDSAIAVEKLKTDFEQRVQYVAELDNAYAKANAWGERLAKKLEDERAIIQTLQAQHQRRRLRELLFGLGICEQKASTQVKPSSTRERTK
jgi:hypothetical protein